MTSFDRRCLAMVLALAVTCASPAAAQSAHELFQQALSRERAEGRLQEAIALYQRVIDTAGVDSALAARALLGVGRCHELLGNEQARAAYQRLISAYPEQATLVSEARARLAGLVKPPAAMAVRRLAVNDAVVSVSPDGSKAIVFDFAKGQNLALYDFTTGRRRLLTDVDMATGYTNYAAWSPDGRRLAYIQSTWDLSVVELRTTTLDGRSQVVHRGVPAAPVGWTPDGRTLVVVMSRPDRTWSVGTLPAEGGTFVPIRSFSWAFDPRNGFPRLSSDGRFIAFVEGDGGLRDIHVVSIDGSQAFRITDDPADDVAPAWSPDGHHLAFVSNRLGSVSLWRVEVRDGRPVGSVTKVKDGMQSSRIVDWTATGIVCDTSSTTLDLYTVAMDAKSERAIGEPRLLAYSRTGRNHSPAFSPDGRSLAFISSNAAEPNRKYVVVMPAGGGAAREFLIPVSAYDGERSPYDLHWFGDGTGVGFSGLDSRRATAVFRLRLSTGEWDSIPVPTRPFTRIEWNRDGSAFYYARQGLSDQNPAGVFERSVDDGSERLIFRPPVSWAAIRALELSPDRTRLAFEVRSLGQNNNVENSSIVVVDLQSGDGRSVFNDTAGLTERSTATVLGWSPGGDLLLLRPRAGGGAPDTMLLSPSGGEPRVFALPALPRTGAGPAMMNVKWSSAGGLLVIGRQDPLSEIFIIENPLASIAGAALRR